MENQDLVEARSFDFVPEAERHGNLRSQFQLWFMINATLITLYTGAVGPLYGLDFVWALVAVVVGSTCGTMFQAVHGAQGPRMDLPQMIQSRVQFGFAIFFIQTGAQAMVDVTGMEQGTLFQSVLGVVAMVVAIVGYKLVLKFEKLASYATLINFIFLTVAAGMMLPIGTMLSDHQPTTNWPGRSVLTALC
ncbi:hypothetical protein HB780_00950 (plasmid) [Rhizobium lusitanum]|uniref:cytosine permease n=1 Tax=Rhizobium lusitanum TaxID=293958 RepID=UPI001620E47E|nr:cytosine permease [Rhizobium lusitanum]QND44407.1 hypothetical protein HB780_00950 [Rhizobium lusitanum]